jgi:hypothetical protein
MATHNNNTTIASYMQYSVNTMAIVKEIASSPSRTFTVLKSFLLCYFLAFSISRTNCSDGSYTQYSECQIFLNTFICVWHTVHLLAYKAPLHMKPPPISPRCLLIETRFDSFLPIRNSHLQISESTSLKFPLFKNLG